MYPTMRCIKINKDGCICGKMLEDAALNSKDLQELIDKMYKSPCFKEVK